MTRRYRKHTRKELAATLRIHEGACIELSQMNLNYLIFPTFPCSELAVSGMGLLAGRIHQHLVLSARVKRIANKVIFILLLLIPFIKPIVAPFDYNRLQDRWVDGVCMQSTFSTCGPASTATLLK
jgi:hypothetical protein